MHLESSTNNKQTWPSCIGALGVTQAADGGREGHTGSLTHCQGGR